MSTHWQNCLTFYTISTHTQSVSFACVNKTLTKELPLYHILLMMTNPPVNWSLYNPLSTYTIYICVCNYDRESQTKEKGIWFSCFMLVQTSFQFTAQGPVESSLMTWCHSGIATQKPPGLKGWWEPPKLGKFYCIYKYLDNLVKLFKVTHKDTNERNRYISVLQVLFNSSPNGDSDFYGKVICDCVWKSEEKNEFQLLQNHWHNL